MRLGAFDLVAVENDAEGIFQAGALEDELDVGGLGIGADGERTGGVAADEVDDAFDQELVDAAAHQITPELLFFDAVSGDGVIVEVLAEQVPHELVVALAVQALGGSVGGQAVAGEVRLPGFGVQGHGIDDDAIHVK